MWKSRLFYLVGCWVLAASALQLVPLFLAIAIGEKASFHSLFSSILTSLLLGGGLVLGFRSTSKIRVPRLTLFLPIWGFIALAFSAGLPFFFLFPEEGFFTSFYEGMSLITTNGTSAYGGAFNSLLAIDLWRAIAAWAGGFFAICISLSLLMAMNVGGLQVHRSPMPFGDSESGYPRLKATALALYPLYILVTVTCWLVLWIGGNPFFDSMLVAMATISTTGLVGISDHYVSGFFTQFTLAIFMIISMSNWDILYVIRRRWALPAGKNLELRAALILISSAVVFLSFYDGSFDPKYLWESVFAGISAISTTGIMPDGYLEAHSSIPLAIVLLTLAGVGGASISASGGLKQLRVIIIYRAGRAELDRLAHPHAVQGQQFEREEINRQDMEAIWLLLGSFILALGIGALALAVMGLHFQDAVSMAFTALTLSGPLIFSADPLFGGFSGLKDADYTILSILMLVGRLEASLFGALFAKSLWRA
ncbi:MAG: hypothetical protein JKY34_06665 [Kordiimonadaceae bacterium]|nr:hypothetical protein [Kordiimonadaceae bacterium]